MRIVLYVNSFLPQLGGREFVVHYLAGALMQLGHEVRVLGPSGFWKHRHQKTPYPVHRWPTLRGFWADQIALLHLTLDTAIWGCDVIHAHNTYPTGYNTVRLRSLRKYPLVITPHGQDIQSIPELNHGLRLDPIKNGKIKLAVRNADLVTAISKNIETSLIEVGAQTDRIRMVTNGVDLSRYSRPLGINIREWLGINRDARLIVTIGRYNPRKGLDYLVRAMPAVLAHDPGARLVIVGNKTEALLPLISELRLQEKVVLTGGIVPSKRVLISDRDATDDNDDPDYLAELLRNCELYVSAGIQNNAEGLSLAVLEAMASGLPVVATSISGNTDVVVDGENGYLVRPSDQHSLSDAMIRILADRNTRASMSLRAIDTAARYDWMNVARKYVDVYQEAIALNRDK